MKKGSSKIGKRIAIAFVILFLFISMLLFFSAQWYIDTYGNVGFDSVLSTLFTDIEGAETGLILDYVHAALGHSVLFLFIFCMIMFWPSDKSIYWHRKEKKNIRIYPFSKKIASIISVVLSVVLLATAAFKVDLVEFVYLIMQESEVYEKYYVDPATAKITFPEEKQNLIYIYLESVETTFFSFEEGGGLEENIIPELYELADENLNFSHNDGIGGAKALSGGTWTIGAMVSHTAGIPLKTPIGVGNNEYGGDDVFLPGASNLSTVLHENGYYQALMVGSDANFGGRRTYFGTHGTDRIYDVYTARRDGIIPNNYYVWWGMEDFYLFEYAKQELTEIAKMDQPFAFTMLTVDTHFPNGYPCKYCGTDHEEQYSNVLSCSSKQVLEFVEWIKQQDFYENTTIIITGDHPTMDNEYMERNVDEDFDRRTYNCFINSLAETDNTKNRVFCTLDFFPTTLAALGCTIEGDRLGLGTNLFSSTPTLSEKMGLEAFEDEISKSSEYYDRFYQ